MFSCIFRVAEYIPPQTDVPKTNRRRSTGSYIILLFIFNAAHVNIFTSLQAVSDFHNQVGVVANLILDEFRCEQSVCHNIPLHPIMFAVVLLQREFWRRPHKWNVVKLSRFNGRTVRHREESTCTVVQLHLDLFILSNCTLYIPASSVLSIT